MAEKLKIYRGKRNFAHTTEPKGKRVKKSLQTLSFSIQHHIASRNHFDLRLEWRGVLLSWAIPKGPSLNPSDKRLAVRVEDHPLEYRDYEGIIPEGQYGCGTVMLWDEGTWESESSVSKGLKRGILKFVLHGQRLGGSWTLIKMKSKDVEQDNWIFVKEKDEFASKTEDISSFVTSIKTGLTMSQIANRDVKKQSKNFHKKLISEIEKTVGRENIIIGEITITNPNKVMFDNSKITKLDMIKYYLKVADRMLPHITHRVTSIVRCPDGLDSCFYKKHPEKQAKGIIPIEIKNKDNDKDEFFCIENIFGIIYEVQMNTIEFHVWGSTIDNLERPDVMVFDLDPDIGMGLAEIRQGVRDLKSILDHLSLTSFLKTSGGKGYHIVIPFRPSANWETFDKFANNVALLMENTWSTRYTSNIRKDSRKNKIFIDWQRNGRGATSVAPYSIRAKSGASVSMPISWKELDTVAPNSIRMEDAIDRMTKPDPWKKFFSTDQQLKPNS